MSCRGIYNPFLMLRTAFVLLLLLGFSAVSAQEVLPETNAGTVAPVVDKLLEAGRQALRDGDLEASARAYREVLRLRPESPEALYQLAIYSFRKQDYVRGFELIKKAVKVSPKNPFPRLALAKAQGEVGEFEAAIEQYQKIIEFGEPGSRPVQTAELEMNLMKFRLAARNRDREQLLKVGTILTSRYSANLSILANVANVYVQAGFFDQAQGIYFSLLKSSPKDPRIDLSLGEMYERMRQPEKAIAHYEAAVEKGRGTPLEKVAQIKSGVLKALLSMQAGKKEQAYQQFLAIIKLDENNVVANMNIAAYLYGKHDLEGAKNAYLRVIEKQPRNLDAQFQLGIVYLDMGNLVDGVRQLDLVVGSAPNARVGQAAQGALGRVAQRFDLAAIRKVIADQEAVRQRLRENPDDAVSLTAMGDILMQQGNRDEAVTYYERAMKADPNYGDAFYKVALIYDDTHKFQKAVDA
jgi:superkiller protein 3